MVEIKNYCKSIKSRPILNNVSYNFEYGKKSTEFTDTTVRAKLCF